MPRAQSRNRKPIAVQWALAIFVVIAFALLTLQLKIHALLAFLLAVNLATVAAYAYDKWAALQETKRIPENSLHLLAALGGSPAAFASQHLFRHKTRKQPFRLRFWLIVLAQIALIVLWFWMAGRIGHS